VSTVTTYHIKFQVWCGRHMLNSTVLLCHPGFACNACKLASKEATNRTACSTSIPVVLPGQLFKTQPAVLCESRRCSGTWDRCQYVSIAASPLLAPHCLSHSAAILLDMSSVSTCSPHCLPVIVHPWCAATLAWRALCILWHPLLIAKWM
jgi:hypothetical protein